MKQIYEGIPLIQNKCCHYCRSSSNCPTKKKKQYVSCPNNLCKKSYCPKCLNTFVKLTKVDCDFCRKECCCHYDRCDLQHKHCFTYRRTIGRYAECPLKWKKKRKSVRTLLEENNNLVASDINKTPVKRADPILPDLLRLGSNVPM